MRVERGRARERRRARDRARADRPCAPCPPDRSAAARRRATDTPRSAATRSFVRNAYSTRFWWCRTTSGSRRAISSASDEARSRSPRALGAVHRRFEFSNSAVAIARLEHRLGELAAERPVVRLCLDARLEQLDRVRRDHRRLPARLATASETIGFVVDRQSRRQRVVVRVERRRRRVFDDLSRSSTVGRIGIVDAARDRPAARTVSRGVDKRRRRRCRTGGTSRSISGSPSSATRVVCRRRPRRRRGVSDAASSASTASKSIDGVVARRRRLVVRHDELELGAAVVDVIDVDSRRRRRCRCDRRRQRAVRRRVERCTALGVARVRRRRARHRAAARAIGWLIGGIVVDRRACVGSSAEQRRRRRSLERRRVVADARRFP